MIPVRTHMAINGVRPRQRRRRGFAGPMPKLLIALFVVVMSHRAVWADDPLGAQPGQLTAAGPSQPDASETSEDWAVHAQSTFLFQYHPGFGSGVPAGPQSLDSGRHGNETTDATIYAGLRLW